MTDPDNLDAEDAEQLRAIIDRSPKIAALVGHVRDFATMMRKRTGARDLPQWIDKANADEPTGLRSFTNGIRTDLTAVTNGLSLPYNSGPVEGHVNRIKTIKAADVRPCKLRPTPSPHPGATLTTPDHGICARADLRERPHSRPPGPSPLTFRRFVPPTPTSPATVRHVPEGHHGR
jgi:hypothetical protein